MIHSSIGDELLSEAYFGKHPDLLKCEKHLEKIRVEALSNFNGIHTGVTESMLKEMRAVEKLFAKIFGFQDVIIDLRALGYANAFTMLTRFNLDDIIKDATKKNKRINDGKTIRYTEDSNKTLYCIAGLELFTQTKLTAAEYLSVLIHEIGHNFYYDDRELSVAYRLLAGTHIMKSIFFDIMDGETINDKLEAASYITGFIPGGDKIRIAAAKFIRNNKTLHDLNLIANNIEGGIKAFSGLFGPFFYIYRNIAYFGKLMGKIFAGAVKAFASLPSAALNLFVNGDNYQNEKFADNFATAYGYGHETITAQKKLDFGRLDADSVEKSHKKSTIAWQMLSLPTDILKVTSQVVGFLGHVHPNSITRCKDQLKYLKAHEKDIQDPRMKKLLMNDIKACEKELKGLEDMYIKATSNQRKYASSLYFQVCAMIGGDFKEYIPTHKTRDNYKYRQMETSNSLQKK